MTEELICQSCGMPLRDPVLRGTLADGTSSADYCVYCFMDGKFTEDMTMEEMIEHCAQFVDEFNKNSKKKYTHEEAAAQMKAFFPHLKRWKK